MDPQVLLEVMRHHSVLISGSFITLLQMNSLLEASQLTHLNKMFKQTSYQMLCKTCLFVCMFYTI